MAGFDRSLALGATVQRCLAAPSIVRWCLRGSGGLKICSGAGGAMLILIGMLLIKPAPVAAFQLTGALFGPSYPLSGVDVLATDASTNQPVASGTTDAGGNFALVVGKLATCRK